MLGKGASQVHGHQICSRHACARSLLVGKMPNSAGGVPTVSKPPLGFHAFQVSRARSFQMVSREGARFPAVTGVSKSA